MTSHFPYHERSPYSPRPACVDELNLFPNIRTKVDDENKVITVSRDHINEHRHRHGIYAAIDNIRYHGWVVQYLEDIDPSAAKYR